MALYEYKCGNELCCSTFELIRRPSEKYNVEGVSCPDCFGSDIGVIEIGKTLTPQVRMPPKATRKLGDSRRTAAIRKKWY